MNMGFVDVDKVIMDETGMKLSQIIREQGDDGFRSVESKVNASLDVRNTVIAPGGSVVYEPEAMAHLRKISKLVYLQVDLPELQHRLGDLKARGVSIQPGMTLADLYAEREPLYRQYADVTVDCNQKSMLQIVQYIRGALKR